MTINPLLLHYANANWQTQYLGADGLVHNRKIISLFGHKIDLCKVAKAIGFTKLCKPKDQMTPGFAKASSIIAEEIRAAGDMFKSDAALTTILNRAILNLNALHTHVGRVNVPKIACITFSSQALPKRDPAVIKAIDAFRARVATPIFAITYQPSIPRQLDLPESVVNEIIRISRNVPPRIMHEPQATAPKIAQDEKKALDEDERAFWDSLDDLQPPFWDAEPELN